MFINLSEKGILEEIEMTAFVGPFGGWEIAIILLIVLIIFGPTKLPQMGQAMGKAIREFKKAGRELRTDVTSDEEEEEKKAKD